MEKEKIVNIKVKLTIPGCPLKAKISNDVQEKVATLDGVDQVNVEFSSMTDEERKKLTEKLIGKQVEQEEEEKPLDFAKHFICVASGKGGVGKSTTTANLAAALAGFCVRFWGVGGGGRAGWWWRGWGWEGRGGPVCGVKAGKRGGRKNI